jgi:hypothetical protein
MWNCFVSIFKVSFAYNSFLQASSCFSVLLKRSQYLDLKKMMLLKVMLLMRYDVRTNSSPINNCRQYNNCLLSKLKSNIAKCLMSYFTL